MIRLCALREDAEWTFVFNLYCTVFVKTNVSYAMYVCYRRAPAVDPEILRTMKTVGFIGYAANQRTRPRNQACPGPSTWMFDTEQRVTQGLGPK